MSETRPSTRSDGTAEELPERQESIARRLVRIIGVQFGLVAVGLHFMWGLPRALVYFETGTLADPRPYLFVASGIAVTLALLGLYMVPEYFPERKVFAFAAVMMSVWIGGYVWWHLGGHGGAIPGVDGYGHPELGNVAILFSDQHLFQPLDFATVSSEVIAISAYLWLLATGGSS